MKKSSFAIIVLSLLLLACSKEEDRTETSLDSSAEMAQDAAKSSVDFMKDMTKEAEEVMQESTENSLETTTEVVETTAEKPDAAMNRETLLALAKKSGCLACHNIDKKLVGPAWADVAARYKGNTGARDVLIQKVKKGGKGVWTEVTGGIAMPPYSPRVADNDIETLVDFVLAL